MRRGKRHNGEAVRICTGSAETDFVSCRARRWDYEGDAKIGFPHAYGKVNFSHGSRGTSQDYGNIHGGRGSEPQGMVGAALSPPIQGRLAAGPATPRIEIRPSPDRFLGVLRYATDQLSIRLRIPSENSTRHRRDYPMVAALEPPTPMIGGRGAPDMSTTRISRGAAPPNKKLNISPEPTGVAAPTA